MDDADRAELEEGYQARIDELEAELAATKLAKPIEIYYNHVSDLGPGWVSGSRRFKSGAEVFEFIEGLLNRGKEILITAYVIL